MSENLEKQRSALLTVCRDSLDVNITTASDRQFVGVGSVEQRK
jgi:hypothetical protein